MTMELLAMGDSITEGYYAVSAHFYIPLQNLQHESTTQI
jgi:lysophospholipase L1-like esterase